MKSILKLFPLLFLLVVFYSCEYENSGLYEPKVNKDVNAPEIQTIKLELEEDTLYLYTYRQIKFAFQSNATQRIAIVKFYLDNTLLSSVNSDNGFFDLNFLTLSEGIHKLKIELFVKSGTGSIADKLGAEGFVLSSNKEWIIRVVKNINANLKSSIKNGYLNLTWNKSSLTETKEYIVYREDYPILHEIGRTKNNEFTDTSYVGEGGVYKVFLANKSGSKYQWGGLRLPKELPSLTLSIKDYNDYKINWTKSKYHLAIDAFKLYFSYNQKLVKATRNSNDTTYKVNEGYFGDYMFYYLEIVPKYLNVLYNPNYFSSLEKFQVGLTCTLGYPSINYSMNEFFPINDDEIITRKGNNNLIRFSLSQNKILAEKDFPGEGCSFSGFFNIYVSPNGNYLTAGAGCSLTNTFFCSAKNFNDNKIIDTRSYSRYPIQISDNGIGAKENYNNIIFIDFKTGATIDTYNNTEQQSKYDIKLSSNGIFFFYTSDSIRLFKYKNSTFSKIGRFNKNIYFHEFIPQEPEKFVYWDGSTFHIKHCEDLSEVTNFQLTDSKIINIDYRHKEILSHKPNHLIVRSLLDGSLLFDIPISYSPFSPDYYLLNHVIYSQKGCKYILRK